MPLDLLCGILYAVALLLVPMLMVVAGAVLLSTAVLVALVAMLDMRRC